ncbi:Integrase core domain protein [Streptomyces sp. ADI92-24]|nr:Integrase core domain protein [Streptomyces sp. ADI92-24]
MRLSGIVGVHLRKKVRTTIPAPDATPVPDLLQRDFNAATPNQKYVGDITYLPIGDGQFLYLATVLDLHSKRLVGWSIADHMRTGLIADALRAAVGTRGGNLRGAIFHSDNGAQYASRHQGDGPGCRPAGPSAGAPRRQRIEFPAPPADGVRIPVRPGNGCQQ